MVVPSKIGVLIMREFPGGEDRAFVTAASRQEFPAQVKVAWRNTDPPRKPLPFNTGKYTWLQPRRPRLQLFSIPQTAKRDFMLNELDFPVPISGCVLLVNLHTGHLMKAFGASWDASISFADIIKSPKSGGIAWLRRQGLPFVIATLQPKSPALSLAEMRRLFELEPEAPVIACPPEFNPEHIEQVLVALVERI
jgi:hypothetical protein